MSCRNFSFLSCVCCNLQTAGVIIGGFGSFLSLYHGIQILVVMKDCMKNNQELKLEHPIVPKLLDINQCYAPLIFGVILFFSFVNFVVSTVLLAGITKLLPQKLIPWLVYQASITIVILIVGLRQLNPTLILVSFVFIYSWCVIWKLFRQMNQLAIQAATSDV